MFGRERKRADEIKDYYELCFEDFRRRTHESIKILSRENRELKRDLEFVLEQVLGTFKQDWCIDWRFDEIRKRYDISDDYEWNKSDK